MQQVFFRIGKRCGLLCNPKLNPKIQKNLEESLMLVTALTPQIGYEKACKIAQFAHSEDITLREAAIKLNYVDQSDFDKLVDPKLMINPQ